MWLDSDLLIYQRRLFERRQECDVGCVQADTYLCHASFTGHSGSVDTSQKDFRQGVKVTSYREWNTGMMSLPLLSRRQSHR